MNIYVIEIYPFPNVLGNDSIVKIKSELSLEDVLLKLEEKLIKEDSNYEYDLLGYILEDYIKKIPTKNID